MRKGDRTAMILRRRRGGVVIGIMYDGEQRTKHYVCMYCLGTFPTETEAFACSDRCGPEWLLSHSDTEEE